MTQPRLLRRLCVRHCARSWGFDGEQAEVPALLRLYLRWGRSKEPRLNASSTQETSALEVNTGPGYPEQGLGRSQVSGRQKVHSDPRAPSRPGSAPGAHFLLSGCTFLRKAARTEPWMGGRGEGRGWWLEVGPGWRRNRDRENHSPRGPLCGYA